jgi:predicted HTH domain antitoxin
MKVGIAIRYMAMKIEIEVPDDVAQTLSQNGSDLSRAAIEAIALEAYRSRQLSGGKVKELLGFSTIMQVHEFLKDHGVYLNYSMADLEQDIRTSDEFLEKRRLGGTHAA